MDFLVFVSEEWLLVSMLLVLGYLYVWRERQKGGAPLSSSVVTQLLNRERAVLLDVRDVAEYKTGHIVGAVNIPHSKLGERLVELEAHKAKTIIVADKMGQHAGQAGRLLREKGYEVCRLQGGMAEWTNQNLPVVKGKETKGKSGKGKPAKENKAVKEKN